MTDKGDQHVTVSGGAVGTRGASGERQGKGPSVSLSGDGDGDRVA